MVLHIDISAVVQYIIEQSRHIYIGSEKLNPLFTNPVSKYSKSYCQRRRTNKESQNSLRKIPLELAALLTPPRLVSAQNS